MHKLSKIKNNFKNFLFTPNFTIRNIFLSLILGIILGYLTLLFAYGRDDANFILKTLFETNSNLKENGTFLLNKILVIGFSGLSVAVALKAKVLNIGVSGQMTFGALIGFLILNSFKHNNTTTFFVGLIVSIFMASFLSFFMGILKIFFKVNEVVTAIMLNWVIVYFAKYFENNKSQAAVLLNEPIYKATSQWFYTLIILFIFLFLAISFWFFFYKTTHGFKILRSGENIDASIYSGYSAKKNKLLIFAISGAIAGIAGFSFYYISSYKISGDLYPVSYGFTGIAVALVGLNNPIGVVFSSILFGALDGPFYKLLISGYKNGVITIFSGVITYFVAITGLWMYFRPVLLFQKYKPKLYSTFQKYKFYLKAKNNKKGSPKC